MTSAVPRLTVVATGPSGPPEDLEPLRAAGHTVVLGRSLDEAGRRPYTEAALMDLCREADVVLASSLEPISRAVLEAAPRLRLVVVPFLTPHNVAHSEAGRRANLARALAQILAVGRGEVPAHVVNPEALDGWKRRLW